MNPIAFHFNGKAIDKYPSSTDFNLKRLIEDTPALNISNENVELFTYDDKGDTPLLTECCKKLGINVINLATPEMISFLKNNYPTKDDWPCEKFTLIFKSLSLFHHMRNNKVKKFFYLLDQNDIYFVGNPLQGIEKLKESGANLLMNAETRCMYWPMLFRKDSRYGDVNKYFANYTDVKNFEDKTYGASSFSSNGHRSCYLNCGAMVGETDYFIDFMSKYEPFIKEFINVNDQTTWHHFHFCHYPRIQIDHKCELFQCMGPNKVELRM
tara:strand:+ start:2928 stop:3731 length:804 start_codon:yes stop_codon:yes gene_type:complete